MRSSDYAPLFRSTVGFDPLFDMLENGVRSEWPPYNIEKTGENNYRITMAVAGFSAEEVELTQHGPELIVIGQRTAAVDDRQILHRGLTGGNFRQVFKLADYVKVAKARLENGLLSVELVREIPEELKPRRISVTSATAASVADTSNAKQIKQDTGSRKVVSA